MNAIPSTSLTISPLDQARAEMEERARAAVVAENARGWWHAARMVRTFGNAGRVMKQQGQMARFFAKSLPEKAAAYRDAMAILARHTGEPIAVCEARASEQDFDFMDDVDEGVRVKRVRSSTKKKQKKKRGSGSMGWRGAETRGESVVVAGSMSGAYLPVRPSHRSRSLLHERDPFPSGFLPFIGG